MWLLLFPCIRRPRDDCCTPKPKQQRVTHCDNCLTSVICTSSLLQGSDPPPPIPAGILHTLVHAQNWSQKEIAQNLSTETVTLTTPLLTHTFALRQGEKPSFMPGTVRGRISGTRGEAEGLPRVPKPYTSSTGKPDHLVGMILMVD